MTTRSFASEPADPVAGWRDGLVRIGRGEPGGKASGLLFFRDMLAAEYDAARYPELDVVVPSFAVIATDVFDAFVEDNDLLGVVDSGATDEELAAAFQAAALPADVRDTFARLLEHVRVPLAVRSSSVLEDAVFCPFAGVYRTKMLPNARGSIAERVATLEMAVKLVFASTFFAGARSAREAMGKAGAGEKMAVVVQEVVGTTRGDRFYPVVSGVARSHDFYAAGAARPEHGVVTLALGLGKTIVDGGVAWSYSPARPKAPPPFGSVDEVMRNSQLRFWHLDLAAGAGGAPIEEDEFLSSGDLADAEADGALDLVASTYDSRSDRLAPGTGAAGPRVLTFAPLLGLGLLPLNGVVRELVAICERAAGGEVEIEFALRAGGEDGSRPYLGFLQVRPMVVSHETVTIDDAEWDREDVLVASTSALGNGTRSGIRDVVFVKPDAFEARHTREIASHLETLNRELVAEGRSYVLIGFGRWGSSDPWLGIPAEWSALSGARVIVEAMLPQMNVDPSQGSHFFHNISSCGVAYLTVPHGSRPGIDWAWLDARPVRAETSFLRHVVLERPVEIKVDGRSRRGAVWTGAAERTDTVP